MDCLLRNGHPAAQDEPQGGIVDPIQPKGFHHHVEHGGDEVAEGDFFDLDHLEDRNSGHTLQKAVKVSEATRKLLEKLTLSYAATNP